MEYNSGKLHGFVISNRPHTTHSVDLKLHPDYYTPLSPTTITYHYYHRHYHCHCCNANLEVDYLCRDVLFLFFQKESSWEKASTFKYQEVARNVREEQLIKFKANGPFARWHHVLLRPKTFRVFLSCANYGFCYLNPAGITKFKYEKKSEKDSGLGSKMTPWCKWPIPWCKHNSTERHLNDVYRTK